jgi:hypothetical protein
MARNIAPRPGSIVALVEVTQRYPKLVQVDQPPWAAAQQQVAFAQLNHVIEIAVSDLEPSVHVEFAERQSRIEHYLPLGRPIRDANAEPGACAIAKGSDGSVRALDFEAADTNQLREEIPKQRTHVRPHTHASRAVRPATAADINLALKCRNEFKNLQYPILINLLDVAKKFAVDGVSVRRRTDAFIDIGHRPAYLSGALAAAREGRGRAKFRALVFRAARFSPRDA